MTQMLTKERIEAVERAARKIDIATVAVQNLADSEDQALRDAPRLKELNRISRQLATLTMDLQRLFA